MKRRSDIERKARPECHPQLRLLNKSPFQGLQMKNCVGQLFTRAHSHTSISICNISRYLPFSSHIYATCFSVKTLFLHTSKHTYTNRDLTQITGTHASIRLQKIRRAHFFPNMLPRQSLQSSYPEEILSRGLAFPICELKLASLFIFNQALVSN